MHRYYSEVSHDIDPEDSGYFEFRDTTEDRSLYVCGKEVGRSLAFVQEKHIEFYVDIVGTDDEHWTNLSPHERRKWYDSMVSIILQISAAPGNICIFCDRGRSRSASFLAGYLVMCCGYSALQAYVHLSTLYLMKRRSQKIGIDRNARFFIFIKWIEANVLDVTNAPPLSLGDIERMENARRRFV